jgi:hypothetical protein
MTKIKDASDIEKMSKMPNIPKNGKSACSLDDLTKPLKTLTKPVEEVAGPEILSKCSEISTFSKVMGGKVMAVSTHSVSEMR